MSETETNSSSLTALCTDCNTMQLIHEQHDCAGAQNAIALKNFAAIAQQAAVTMRDKNWHGLNGEERSLYELLEKEGLLTLSHVGFISIPV